MTPLSPIISFTLPWPPSHNSMYANRIQTTSRLKGRRLSDKARAYKKQARDYIFYTFPKIKFENNKVCVDIVFNRPDNRRRDTHNLFKILFDSITESGIILDDSQIVRGSFKDGQIIEGGSVDITISQIDNSKLVNL